MGLAIAVAQYFADMGHNQKQPANKNDIPLQEGAMELVGTIPQPHHNRGDYNQQ
jgi:hypothetical protein